MTEGNLHREGVMRLATAADEILPLKDPRVQSNEAYLIVILLSRVVTRLGSVAQVKPKVIEGLYRRGPRVPAGVLQPHQPRGQGDWRHLPACSHEFDVEMAGVGGL